MLGKAVHGELEHRVGAQAVGVEGARHDEPVADAGAKWDSSEVQDALRSRIGTELLFPVYDVIKGTGSNAQYHVIAWVGFHLTSFDARGSSGSITGWFTEVVWTGIASTKSAGGQPNLGARVVNLVD